MNGLFKALGLLLAGYVVIAGLSGAVYAKSGVWGDTFRRLDRPLAAVLCGGTVGPNPLDRRYWSAIAAYTFLSVALILCF